MAEINFNKVKINVNITEAASRQDLNSGDSVNTLFGKIKKWLSDLKAVAFSGSYNDLSDKPKIPNVDSELSETSENPVQNKVISNAIKGGEVVSGSSSYTIENTVDYPLIGLNIFGKSTQNGTPTPESPVEIVSVGDSGFDIISKNDTHFNLLSVRDNGGEIITKQPVSTAAKVGNQAIFTVAASGTGLTYQWKWSADGGITWKNTSTTAATYSVMASESFNGYKYRCVVTDANGKSVTSNEVTLYVVSGDCEINTASIETALPLCGIPVSNGGNYTDSNGQQWVCDELIYNADGTGKIIKRTQKIIFDGSDDEGWATSQTQTSGKNRIITKSIKSNVFKPQNAANMPRVICDNYSANSADNTYFNNNGISIDTVGSLIIYDDERSALSAAEWKSSFAANPITVVYQFAEPQEIELTAAEMDAFRQLQTFNGTTSISNSAGAEMSVKYCTNKALSEFAYPITMGLQKQIDELRAAILSMGGNV